MTLYRIEGYKHWDIKNPCEFTITKETPCGWWIDWNGTKKWVSKTGKKRFAYPTYQEALNNFIARKKSQIRHLDRQRDKAEEALLRCGIAYIRSETCELI